MYRREKKVKNLSVQFVTMIQQLRQQLNQSGHSGKSLIAVGDGSFCNRTVFGKDWIKEGVAVLTRCRKDLVLCKRARNSKRRFYGKTKFTPERVRQRDGLAPWQTVEIFHGGRYRERRQRRARRLPPHGAQGRR